MVSMQAELTCFEAWCRARFAITEPIYNCPKCGGLLEVTYESAKPEAGEWKALWRERRMSNAPMDTSGVWRYREMLPFEGQETHIVDAAGGEHAAAGGARGRRNTRARPDARSSIRASIRRGRSKTTA